MHRPKCCADTQQSYNATVATNGYNNREKDGKPKKTYENAVRSIIDNDTTDVDEFFSLQLSFKHARETYERVVAGIVGDPVHVDMVLKRLRRDKNDAAKMGHELGNHMYYTAYMNEKFSVNIVGPAGFPDEVDRSTVDIRLTLEEYHRVQQYLVAMVDRVSYNYKDLVSLSPVCPKTTLGYPNFPEIVGFSDPSNVKKVYCSQAVVLVLKSCLGYGQGGGDIQGLANLYLNVSSRVISPFRLFNDLRVAIPGRVTVCEGKK